MTKSIHKTDEAWRAALTPQQYAVLREKATESPFSGELLFNHQSGIYACAACGTELFDSETKFDSHSGWPSFYDAKPGAVAFQDDSAQGMSRVEVTCANCGGHLGHIFDDASDQPTGKRYCINSLALDFKEKE